MNTDHAEERYTFPGNLLKGLNLRAGRHAVKGLEFFSWEVPQTLRPLESSALEAILTYRQRV